MFSTVRRLYRFLSLAPGLTSVEFRTVAIFYGLIFTALTLHLWHRYDMNGGKVWEMMVTSAKTEPIVTFQASSPKTTEDQNEL